MSFDKLINTTFIIECMYLLLDFLQTWTDFSKLSIMASVFLFLSPSIVLSLHFSWSSFSDVFSFVFFLLNLHHTTSDFHQDPYFFLSVFSSLNLFSAYISLGFGLPSFATFLFPFLSFTLPLPTSVQLTRAGNSTIQWLVMYIVNNRQSTSRRIPGWLSFDVSLEDWNQQRSNPSCPLQKRQMSANHAHHRKLKNRIFDLQKLREKIFFIKLM